MKVIPLWYPRNKITAVVINATVHNLSEARLINMVCVESSAYAFNPTDIGYERVSVLITALKMFECITNKSVVLMPDDVRKSGEVFSVMR